jgi:hypothetical protein
MRFLITLIATLFLLANTSVTLAGGHKSKAPKADDGMATDAERGGDKNKHKDKDRHKKEHQDGDHDHADKNNHDNEKSQQKRAESDDRKAAHDDYKSTREPGQEGKKGKDGEPQRKSE